ncbi:hypothetical protein [Leifsonia kafniensis]
MPEAAIGQIVAEVTTRPYSNPREVTPEAARRILERAVAGDDV